MERWSDEKREIVIEDCDPEILAVVVDYMYGIDLPRLVVSLHDIDVSQVCINPTLHYDGMLLSYLTFMELN